MATVSTYPSPLDPDDQFALYRVVCPDCRTAVWASLNEPPVNGEEIVADSGHECRAAAEVAAP